MKKAILVIIAMILCISTFACKEISEQSKDESSKAQQAINTESDDLQSAAESSDGEMSEIAEISDEISAEASEPVSEVSAVPKLPDETFYANVKEIEDDAIIVEYYDYTVNTMIAIRVKCCNADEFCQYDGVNITYSGEADKEISENYYEITAISVVYEPGAKEKPVIYLYPTAETEVSVKLYFDGDLFCTYPEYNNGWKVTAQPDGTLLNNADGKEYSYLFWEGNSDVKYDMSKGFVVKGTDTVAFLQEKLAYLGLTPKEYNEFIVYWLPKMQDNEYNLITFQDKAYTDNAVLDISPQPDSILRVFMAYKPLDEYIEIEEQELDTFTREGFTVVEWGGTCVK